MHTSLLGKKNKKNSSLPPTIFMISTTIGIYLNDHFLREMLIFQGNFYFLLLGFTWTDAFMMSGHPPSQLYID